MKPRKPLPLLLASLLAGAAVPALAVPFTVEGRLGAVDEQALTCNRARIQMGPNTVISTPTGVIDRAKLTDTQPFPGRGTAGTASAFLGGTCIVSGDDAGGTRLADTVFVEIAENVLVGAVSSAPGQPFEILGVPIVLLSTALDAPGYEPGNRIVASEPINGFGYEVDLANVPLGDESSAEGYLSTETNLFYAHAVETSGGPAKYATTAPDTRVLRGSVTRASNTTLKLEVRGGCRFLGAPNANGTARSQRLNVQMDNGTDSTGQVVWANPSALSSPTAANATCNEDTAAPGYGVYRYLLDRYTGFRAVPTMTRVKVVPSTAYPTTVYSAELVLDRAGF